MQPKTVSFPMSHLNKSKQTNRLTFKDLLLATSVGRRSSRATAGSSVGGTPTSAVVVGAPVVIGVVIRAIAVGVVIATTPAGVCSSGGVVVITLAVGS